MKPALIIVDMLYEFVKGRLRSPQAEKIVPIIKKLIEAAHERGVPVIHVVDQHYPSDPELKLWGPHALAGSSEAKIIDELAPSENDIVIPKHGYSGFRDTPLDLVLRSKGVDTIIVTGIHTHICVLHTVGDAFYYGYNIIVVEDGVAAFSEKDHEYALEYMRKIYGAKIVDSKTAIEVMKTGKQV
ncbi:cysteine hydrolase [Desulfurococcaceae archaeon MEX13E-LK6-19]|nr:cysteine hydrolase [Desulfurococcaceae archaeon MEX13E-LK6-19]